MKLRIFVNVVIIILLLGCDKMDSIHEKYYELSERVYVGIPDLQSVNPGYNRALVSWKISRDPKIDRCCIYWSKKDSMVVSPNYSDTIMRQMVELPEGIYRIEMINWSKDGNRSLVKSMSVETYGDEYRSKLLARPISSVVRDGDDVTIKWGSRESCVYVDLIYTDLEGFDKTVRINMNEYETILEKCSDNRIYYVSYFLPFENAVDTVAIDPEFIDTPSL